MGADESKVRDITIERVDDQDGNIGVIKITDSVLRRLTGQPEVEKDTSSRLGIDDGVSAESASKEAVSKETKAYIEKLEKELDTCYSEFDDAANKLKEGEICIPCDLAHAFFTSMKESDKKLIELRPKTAKVASPVCQDLEEKVLQCYRDNPNATVLCSEVVKDFRSCVEKTKKKLQMPKPDSKEG
ncbi:MICOS complex subunit mic25a isoform X1 [Lingula anatina]|uniref:MICOS complex subunit mic25a isoform X1 n=1 Tax=Lingula anatina TaxID=7574 RepID=A0A1S3H3C9_LINAN|nr:MICOS complex subunit mic25a isoform X1 [Lingula anatina]|eukprot:XP_013380457.2 MICOS complex subunit mic25a isoform X1 [Lingula anatina]